jgi:hypothetical protein
MVTTFIVSLSRRHFVRLLTDMRLLRTQKVPEAPLPFLKIQILRRGAVLSRARTYSLVCIGCLVAPLRSLRSVRNKQPLDVQRP